jgi:hypothetical protein
MSKFCKTIEYLYILIEHIGNTIVMVLPNLIGIICYQCEERHENKKQ